LPVDYNASRSLFWASSRWRIQKTSPPVPRVWKILVGS
jgi:hypothetical protein